MYILRHILIAIGSLLLFSGCKEVFNPEIEKVSPSLVVEALFTNHEEHQKVYLTRARAFGSEFSFHPVEFAKVWVEDDANNYIEYEEISPGYYQTVSTVAAQDGVSYKLHIETQTGLNYVSKAQSLPGEIELESIFTRFESFSLLDESLTVPRERNIEVINLYTNVSSENLMQTNVRVESSIKLIWLEKIGPIEDISYHYHWLRKNITNYLPHKVPAIEPGEDMVHDFMFSFFPFDMQYLSMFSLPDVEYRSARFMLTSFYAVNADVYDFYHSKDLLLQSEGKLFDPMYVELKGNMYNVNDHAEAVFGVFEVSRKYNKTFLVKIPSGSNPEPAIMEIEDLSHWPAADVWIDEVPPFWHYQYLE